MFIIFITIHIYILPYHTIYYIFILTFIYLIPSYIYHIDVDYDISGYYMLIYMWGIRYFHQYSLLFFNLWISVCIFIMDKCCYKDLQNSLYLYSLFILKGH